MAHYSWENTLIQRIAIVTGVTGDVLDTYPMTFEGNADLSGFLPLFFIARFTNGVLGICQIRIKTNAGYILAATALDTLDATNDMFMGWLTGAVAQSGNIGVEVVVASLAPSAFSLGIYGIPR